MTIPRSEAPRTPVRLRQEARPLRPLVGCRIMALQISRNRVCNSLKSTRDFQMWTASHLTPVWAARRAIHPYSELMCELVQNYCRYVLNMLIIFHDHANQIRFSPNGAVSGRAASGHQRCRGCKAPAAGWVHPGCDLGAASGRRRCDRRAWG